MRSASPVLVVSSSPVMRELFDLVLSQAGYPVHCSDQDHLDPHGAASIEPSLIVFAPALQTSDPCDAVRPLRQDPRSSSIPVLVCSSSFRDGAAARLRQIGGEPLDLPFRLEDLYEATERLSGPWPLKSSGVSL